jgi:hypothetical protein
MIEGDKSLPIQRQKFEVVKMVSLDTIEENFQKILISKDSWDKKNQSLSFLMTQLERFYNIEILEKFTTEEQKNSREFKLYVEIAHSRKF